MEFRYGIAPGVKVTLTVDDSGVRYKQGLKKIAVPWAEVGYFGVRERASDMGMVASELLVTQRSADGKTRVRKFAFDPSAEPCQQALAAIRARCSPEADTTSLPWAEAAARIGVVARPWYEPLLQPKISLGIIVILASLLAMPLAREVMPPANSAEAVGQLIAGLIGVAVGVMLIRRGRRELG